VSDIPNNSEFNARTLPSADYVIVSDTIAGVTLVDTVTTNTDMVGTDNAATEGKQDAGDTVRNRISTIQEADNSLDKTTTPWSRKTKTKGTATVLLKKNLTDIDGVDVTTTGQIIATETDETP
jgi:hypothetical protein